MKDETGDALALLIVMFYLSTLSLRTEIKFQNGLREGGNTSMWFTLQSPLMDLKKTWTLGRLVSECHAMVVYVCVCDCI